MNALQLKEKLGSIWEQMRDIKRNAENEGREILSQEERNRFDVFSKEYDEIKGDYKRAKKFEELEAQKAEKKIEAEREAADSKNKAEKKPDKKQLYESAFRKYMRSGSRGLNQDELMSLSSGQMQIRGTSPQTTTVTAGGYMIPEGFSNELETRLVYYGPMLDENLTQVFRTETGNQIPWPTVDDTSVTGAILNEDTPAVVVSDMTFGQKLLNAFTYHSNIVKISVPLLMDAAFDLDSFLADALARRLGTAINTHLTTGDHSSKPNGIVTALNADSRVYSFADDVTVARTDLVGLIHNVDRAYRFNGSFMMNDATLSEFRQLGFGSADDRPIYLAGDARNGEPDILEGHPVFVNNDMATIAADARTVIFGDFKKYVVRLVNGITLVRLDERYMDQLQVGFIAYLRADGECIQTNALSVSRQTNT